VIPPVILKVGGSLFDWPDLPARLSSHLAQRRAGGRRLVLLAGGGRAADLVRELDRTFGLGDLEAHRLALRSLDLTAHALAGLVPGLDVVEELPALAGVWNQGRIPVLAPRRWLDEVDARSADALPPSWDVTSDAIAARVASVLGAEELVLLKSAPLPAGSHRREAARLGLVDPVFPDVSRSLEHVVYLNFRETPHAPIPLAR
jgi:5-(aminomethyl)-3-furanmethanol phosphate kinase